LENSPDRAIVDKEKSVSPEFSNKKIPERRNFSRNKKKEFLINKKKEKKEQKCEKEEKFVNEEKWVKEEEQEPNYSKEPKQEKESKHEKEVKLLKKLSTKEEDEIIVEKKFKKSPKLEKLNPEYRISPKSSQKRTLNIQI